MVRELSSFCGVSGYLRAHSLRKSWPVDGVPSTAYEWAAHVPTHLYFWTSWATRWTWIQHTLKMVSGPPFS